VTEVAPAQRRTGSATHSPIIGTWPRSKIGHAACSSALRLAASRPGSSPVPERYGPAIRINIGLGVMSARLRTTVQKREGVRMLAAERRDFLLSRLSHDGKLVAKDVAAELGLSEDSLRRDLRELAAEGLCLRVYGGALPASPAVADYAARVDVAPDSKRRVAQRAVELIRPRSTVILDGGTTTLAVVHALPRDLHGTVVTHSVTIASALVEHPSVDVFVIGGALFKHSAVSSGAAAVEAAQRVNADLFLLGVTGVHARMGLTTGDADEAAMKRALSARAGETFVLASAEKIGTASPYEVLPLDAVAGIVTDAAPKDPTITALRHRGVEILRA
jgi:DeoR/GlpR family transcriptional regulator of sugar metabolism